MSRIHSNEIFFFKLEKAVQNLSPSKHSASSEELKTLFEDLRSLEWSASDRGRRGAETKGVSPPDIVDDEADTIGHSLSGAPEERCAVLLGSDAKWPSLE